MKIGKGIDGLMSRKKSRRREARKQIQTTLLQYEAEMEADARELDSFFYEDDLVDDFDFPAPAPEGSAYDPEYPDDEGAFVLARQIEQTCIDCWADDGW